MPFDQGEFDFDAPGSEDGYRNWQKRLDEQKRAFERKWGIVLGRRVRVTLRNHDRPLEGEIYLVDENISPSTKDIRLRIKGFEFARSEVAGIVRIRTAEKEESGEQRPDLR
jgi:hypothetical protein